MTKSIKGTFYSIGNMYNEYFMSRYIGPGIYIYRTDLKILYKTYMTFPYVPAIGPF